VRLDTGAISWCKLAYATHDPDSIGFSLYYVGDRGLRDPAAQSAVWVRLGSME